MGCGASSDAAATPIVPEAAQARPGTGAAGTASQRAAPPKPAGAAASPASPPPKGSAQVADGSSSAALASPASLALPPGLSSFKNSPAGAASVGSVRRGSVMASPGLGTESDELMPLKGTPRGKAPGGGGADAPAGSQIPGLNYCNAEFFPTHMEQVWSHYARPPDYKLIDKTGLKTMSDDCVSSFSEAASKYLRAENPKWDSAKVEAKIASLRAQFLPGKSVDESVLIGTHYLAHELKYTSSDSDPKLSGVTKPCFFLHFQRAHRLLFSFTGGANITLERELIVQRLNKQQTERVSKGIQSVRATKGSSKDLSAAGGTASAKGTKSAKSAKHKSKKNASENSKLGAASHKTPKSENMFGAIDFGSPAPTGSDDGRKSLSNK